MLKRAIPVATAIAVVSVLALAATAWGAIGPHGEYSSSTDFCIKCHDIHEADGDYVLTRAATVTATCGTCHGLFGQSIPPGTPVWTNPPTNFSGIDPTTASSKPVYRANMAGMTAQQMDDVPGHSLGVMLGGTVVRSSDAIPGGSNTLKVMTSGQYGGPNANLYGGQAVTTYNGTKGLYCASCHTPHANFGQELMLGEGDPGAWAPYRLLSAKPNHISGTITTGKEADFCLACHDRRSNADPNIKNHPAAYCLSCHGQPQGGTPDFPHTSSNKRILTQEADALCVTCHTAGNLP